MTKTTRASMNAQLQRLTAREREILTLITAGHPNREVAAQLGISPRTVEVHKARIMEKLACHSLAELIRTSIAAGAPPRAEGLVTRREVAAELLPGDREPDLSRQ